VRRAVKKYLIPHKDNDFKPHLLREEGVLAVFAVVLILFLGFFAYSALIFKLDLLASILPGVLVDYANQGRVESLASPLTMNPLLEEAARKKAEDMAANGYFAHFSPEGRAPWDFIKEAGYNFSYAGENLAIDFSDSVDVYQAWMDSPSHRANILNRNFKDIGIATAKGVYQGRDTTFVVQMFGRQRVAPLPLGEQPIPRIVQAPAPSTQPQTQVLSEMFIAIEDAESTYTNADETENNADKIAASTNYSNIIEEAASSPRKAFEYAYLILGLLVLIVTALSLFHEIHKRHPKHIAYAVFMLIFIFSLAYFSNIIFGNVLIV